jgi:hypothetical protein
MTKPFVVPTLTADERRNLEALIDGASYEEQPTAVRDALRDLQRRGLVHFSGTLGRSGYEPSLGAMVALGRKLTAHQKRWIAANR